MVHARAQETQQKLIAACTDLVRRNGYVATSVDEICAMAGVTKGAFFHHFATKEALAEACLRAWDASGEAMDASAPHHAVADLRAKVAAYMDFYIGLFENPSILKSCLAGTTVQEVSASNTRLRDASNECFMHAEQRFVALLDAARGDTNVDTPSLARLWMATLQGALILHKASADAHVIPASLRHVKRYIVNELANGAT